MKNVFYYETEIGNIGIVENGTAITNLFFGNDVVPLSVRTDTMEKETPLLKKAAEEIREYLAGKRTEFDLPLAPEGTAFQLAAWEALCTIPYGETRSYKQIAEQVGRPKACRAIGMANNRNPIAIVVPCHRVIGSNGALVGYASGLDVKARLLDIEKRL